MNDKILRVAVILSAVDRMSSVVNQATGRSISAMEKMRNKASGNILKAAATDAAADQIFDYLDKPLDAFKKLEDASLRLRSVMMRDGGIINESQFDRMNSFVIELGNKLPGTTADFQQLASAFLENGGKVEDFLNGSGKALAYFAVQMKLAPEVAGQFGSKMANAMKIPGDEMAANLDVLSRFKNAGIEDITEMQQFFSKAALSARGLGITGKDAFKELGIVGAMFIRGGLSGQTTGTNFARLMSALNNTTKQGEFNRELKELGITMNLFDGAGKFKGVANFVAEMGKLRNLSPEQISKVITPLVGQDGKDLDMLRVLMNSGTAEWNTISKQIQEQATLTQKVDLILTSLINKEETAAGTFENMLAAVGAQYAEGKKVMLDWLNPLLVAVQKLAQSPLGAVLIRFIAIMATLSVIALKLYAAFLVLKAGIWAVNLAFAANPIVLIIIAVIALIALLVVLYQQWDKLKAWFKTQSPIIRGLLTFMFWPVMVLIESIKYLVAVWPKIKGYFGGKNESVTKVVGSSVSPFKVLEKPQKTISSQINYQPNITIAAGADKNSFAQQLKEHSKELMNMIEQSNRLKARASY